jgi:hypothetical protein
MKAVKPEEVAKPAPRWSDLGEARYATPGTPENKAYHAKLDAINKMAAEIRAKREGR